MICNPSNGDDIDILIGLDYYWTFVTDEVRRGENGPVAINSRLGCLVSGPIYDNNLESEEDTHAMLIATKESESVEMLVEKLWSLDSLGIKESSEEDVMQRFLVSVYFNQNGGRYCVSLPWREGVGMLADNFELCQLIHYYLENTIR